MNTEREFQKELLQTALPVTLQCLIQSSFSVIDQIMTGQLGSVSIAGIGLGGKFASLFSVMISAVAAAAGIMIAQYIGKKDHRGAGRSFWTNLAVVIILALIFAGGAFFCPAKIMSLYTKEKATVQAAVKYIRIYAISFFPAAVIAVASSYLRCVQAARLALYGGICGIVLNTVLNYLLIFGHMGFPAMGVEGAAWASVLAQCISCLLLLSLLERKRQACGWHIPFILSSEKAEMRQYLGILIPIFVCEFFWGLGENVYAVIYGHMGTVSLAAMTLTGSIQMLVTGALSGVAQAAGVMMGKQLGADRWECAYRDGKKLMLTGLCGSLFLSVMVAVISGWYVRLFQVEENVRETARMLLRVYALVAPVKIQNMILGGGILRSGGKTKYVMAVDLIGTWLFGVPMGLAAAFFFHLPVPAVYFILSLEEGVRFVISLAVFKKKIWMQRL